MRSLLYCAALTLAPTLVAQNTDQAMLQQGQRSVNCPVGIEASPRNLPVLRSVDGDTKTRLHDKLAFSISLSPYDSKLVKSAQVKLFGTDRGLVLRAADGDRSKLTSESFTISGSEAVVYTRKLTGVRWVEIESLTYSDGEMWSQTRDSVCRVSPKGFMPVEGVSSSK